MSSSKPESISRRNILRTAVAIAATPIQSRAVTSGSKKSTDVKIKAVAFNFEPNKYRWPYKFGGSVVDETILFNVTLRAERADGKSAEGFGSMPLGNVWSFPPRYVPVEASLAAMKLLAEEVIKAAQSYKESGHPIELSTDMQKEWLRRAMNVGADLNLARPIPKLCTLVVASALDAALHDAYGKVNNINSYDALSATFVNRDLSYYLDDRFKNKYPDAYVLPAPKSTVSIFHSVSALDALTDGDIKERLNDGLPESLVAWTERDGLTHFKIKLNGADLNEDVNRMLAIERALAETQKKRGVDKWSYCADFNERCPSVDYVLDFCAKVKEHIPAALDRILYLEQPTDRDLKAHPQNKVHAAAKIKPVVIDESLTDYETLLLARAQGYTGLALKACKGITETLLMAAAGRELGMFLTVQDLTCPGASFLESAEISARIPKVVAMEANAREYCPAANKGWAEKYPDVFTVRNGTINTAGLTKPGLGH